MMAMVGKNDDAQATSSSYFTPKRNLMSGLGGSIVEHPLVRKGKDELAGKFRYGKTILITDLMYKCSSNTRGMTNIQYGLDELGYTITVVDINSFTGTSKAQKFFNAVDYLKKEVMETVKNEDNLTYHIWMSFAFHCGPSTVQCVG